MASRPWKVDFLRLDGDITMLGQKGKTIHSFSNMLLKVLRRNEVVKILREIVLLKEKSSSSLNLTFIIWLSSNYRQVYNIRRTESQHLKDFRTV